MGTPLCFDLDGTLIASDVLWEGVVALLRQRPWSLFLLPFWVLRGRSYLKRQVATRGALAVDQLPYRREVLQFLRQEHQAGRKIVLVTAADRRVAETVAAHLGDVDEVHASDEINLKGRRKAELLARQYGQGCFDYVGDSVADVPVWKAARAAYVVGGKAMVRRAERAARVERVFASPGPDLATWIHSIRLHHWSKNVLIFLPLLAAHNLRWHSWQLAIAAFLLFGTCASGLYLLNDLLDLHSDRTHSWKSLRPLASGRLSLWTAVVQAAVLIAGSLALSLWLNRSFALVLFSYALLTIVYSCALKKYVLLDVFVLSSFYAARILAGALATGTPLSTWMIGFSGFFFLSLAMAKRHSELMHAADQVRQGNSGRGYRVDDRDVLAMLGVASSFAAVVILAMYAHAPEVTALYGSTDRLLLLCPVVLYWLSRVWLIAFRGELMSDPVVFAITDPASWAMALVSVAILVLSGIRAG